MKIIKQICERIIASDEPEQNNSTEYTVRTNRCVEIYDELSTVLNDEQKKKFRELNDETLLIEMQRGNEKFKEGTEKGFKLAMKLIIDSMRD